MIDISFGETRITTAPAQIKSAPHASEIEDFDTPDSERWPSGWYILPAAFIGAFIWYYLFSRLLLLIFEVG